ncbi:MAG: matrixin family metalloprotease [Candidatus Uhrbacteria bacterium]|nr:matrixin family metalloprotease [Candidatus Uhrbacteria bacterium]
MKTTFSKFFVSLGAVLLILGFGVYYYGQDAGRLVRVSFDKIQPCQRPILYSIENIDPRFGLTKAELLASIKKAEKVWGAPIGKQLFEYSPDGDLKINVIYDYRQKATDAMKKIGIVIHDDQSTYDTLKAKYDALAASYAKENARIDRLVLTYSAEKSAYEKDVNYWNSHGGAPKREYALLEQKKNELHNQVTAINQAKALLNGLVDTMNSAAIVINKLIGALNLQVDMYNTVGSSAGKEFSEGEYTRDGGKTAINVFQFNDTDQLVRVLTHEFGHALGIEHLDSPKSLMYYRNEGINGELTVNDLAALRKTCGIK